jgi:hypothetical protein
MIKKKSFDCVEMKNAIQAQLLKEHEGLSDEEIAHRRREWLETSKDPLAVWWRSIPSAQSTTPSNLDTASAK